MSSKNAASTAAASSANLFMRDHQLLRDRGVHVEAEAAEGGVLGAGDAVAGDAELGDELDFVTMALDVELEGAEGAVDVAGLGETDWERIRDLSYEGRGS